MNRMMNAIMMNEEKLDMREQQQEQDTQVREIEFIHIKSNLLFRFLRFIRFHNVLDGLIFTFSYSLGQILTSGGASMLS